MIIIIVGGIGSGKTLYATKTILSKKENCYGNYFIRGLKNYSRLKVSDVIIRDDKKVVVNWQFWEKQIEDKGGFHIMLDEMHNLMHSRRSMSRENIALTRWISQIRKVTGENEFYDLICITQEIERVDVAIRDLAQKIIYCSKHETLPLINTVIYKKVRKKYVRMVKSLPETWVYLTFFNGHGCVRRYQHWRDSGVKGLHNGRTAFFANPFFKFYDSYEITSFGEDEFL